MTAVSYMIWRLSILPVLCLILTGSIFLAACGGAQPTLGTTVQPDPQPTSVTIEQPPSDQETHVYPDSTWFVAPSLEEQIFDALTYDSYVIVRASLASATAGTETVPGAGASATYRPAHELKFTVHEYLEGSGPNEILVVVRSDKTYPTEALARREADWSLSGRNTSWDNRQAVLFVGLDDTTYESAEGTSTKSASFSRSNPLESAWDYTVDNLSRAWLPAEAVAGGATGGSGDPEFITDGAKSPPPTITLAKLKAEIASLKAELTAGNDIAGFRECISGRILRERIDRATPSGPRPKQKTIASGLEAGTNVFKYDEPFNTQDPEYSRGWLKGSDSGRFEAVTIDGDENPSNGYNLGFATERPLPAGEYSVHYLLQHYSDMPCNFKPDNRYSDWTVTVTAPTDTAHEAFFDPVAIGTGVGADASNGVLEPKTFKVGQVSTSLRSLKWEGGSTTLSLSAAVSLSGHALDFIALDGTVAHSLDGGAAAVSGSTLTWSVASQPWKAGDKLMLRIRQGSPSPTATPTPSARY